MYTFQIIDPKSEDDINLLYKLITNKSYNISNYDRPSFAEHKYFVENHPYKKWYKIIRKDITLGTFYLSKINTIGINLNCNDHKIYMKVIEKILFEYEPDPEIKSIRNKYFTINCAPSNKELIKALKELGLELIQETYIYRKSY